ncbi:polyketide synthase [Sorangium cellulosum]|uniref:Polyketide synthase n=1 Tax=Sorangium cellulosum TaxID=56 RepID=A0A2L0FBY5_SORCE|nr:type I polyketide synthase [Sorangium cellulosum]AUX48982.1 polyketide synthase [Sorangium cellulosum]
MRELGELRDAIAIIGLSGRFPQAKDPEAFWRNLCEGKESIARFTAEELLAAGVPRARVGDPSYVRARPCLEDPEWFDADFFGYSDREARWMDPQQRIFLECAHEALEHAGVDPERYAGWIGVFAGAGMNTYLLEHQRALPTELDSAEGLELLIASEKDYLATRVSYKLDLKGPSLTVQTACSTGLVAVHQACQSLRALECDMAIAGAVSVMFPERRGYLYETGGPCSPDGRCRPFDARAAGTVFGDAAGAVLLKRLEDALEQGDFIHAILLGSATNNDGSAKVGYTAPSVEGQASVITLAHELAGVRPATIDYVEAHGTGTSLGDPIEVRALEQAFRRDPGPLGRCALGSVKANIGHASTAAGIVGLIKTVLALRNEQIPPTIHYERPNPEIALDHTPFYVNAELRAWPRRDSPRRAGVSSFGIGGTNAHVVLQEGPPYQAAPGGESEVLLLSARSEEALSQVRSRLADHLERHGELSLRDVAFTLAEGKRRFLLRDSVVASSLPDAVARLREPRDGRAARADGAGVVMLFTGQGSQHPGMGRALYEEHALVRETVDACAGALVPLLGLDVRRVLFDGSAEELRDTGVAQPALFVVEYAVARWLESWGARPAALLGHSVGELVAACVGGVLSLEDALRAVAARARLMRSLPPGAMLAVPLSERAVLEGLPEELSLAAVNGPALCVVSGSEAAVARYEAQLRALGVHGRRLHTAHAFHSRATEPIVREFREVMAGLTLREPRIPILSNVTGAWMTGEMAQSPQYWADHLRRTVRFADGVTTLLERGEPRLFVEVGPGSTLCSLVRAQLRGAEGSAAIPVLPGPGDAGKHRQVLLEAMGALWARGADLRWKDVFPRAQARRVPLPTYPFERRRHAVDAAAPEQPTIAAATGAPESAAGARLFRLRWSRLLEAAPASESAREQPWLLLTEDHEGARALEEQLRRSGVQVITARPGPAFAEPSAGAFVVRPDSEGDLRALVAALGARGVSPRRIVHLWSALRGPGRSAEEALRQGLLSVCALARSLGDAPRTEGVELTVVTRGAHAIAGEARPAPDDAALIGLCRSLPNELPSVRCRVVDVVMPQGGEASAPWARALARELSSEAEHDLVLLRAQQRWIPTFEAMTRATGPSRLRERGVYVITGAFGGIGLRLAEHLARAHAARLVLMGRTPLPPRPAWQGYRERDGAWAAVADTLDALERIEASGAELLVAAGDVAVERDVDRVFAEARARFGRVDGVFHCAGIPGAGPLRERTNEDVVRVLSPKTTGTWNLAARLAEEPEAFLVLCSSIFSHLGAIGQADYAAANAFLDAFAAVYQDMTGNPGFAVAWDGWEQVGMAARAGITAAGPLRPGPASKRRGPHPLIDRVEGGASGPRVFHKTFSLARDWTVHEHRMRQAGVVPGAALIEMARAAAALTGLRAVAIHDVRFHAPCRVEDGAPRRVCLAIEPRGARTEFTVLAAEPDGREERIASGYWTPAEDEGARGPAAITSIRERCAPAAPRRLFEAVNATGEVQWGPRWDNVASLRAGDDEVLAELRLRPELAGDLSEYGLHPALLDVATAITAELDPGAMVLPVGYGRIVCLSSIPERLFSHVRLRRQETVPGRTLVADVTLLDEQGRVIAEIARFVLERVEREAEGARPDRARRTARGIDPEDGIRAIEQILTFAGPEQIVVSPHAFASLAEQQRRARREPSAGAAGAARALRDDERPRDEIERALSAQWEELLGRRPIGIHDPFFELGGHSLLAVQALSRIKESFDVELPKQDIFEGATVARLAEKITNALAERLELLEQLTSGAAGADEPS